MSNFFWTADGQYINKNLYEHLNNLSVTDDKFCIQDTCLSKDEMIQLKESITNYNIFENVNNKDVVTIREIKEYLKEIFRIIHTSSDNDRMTNINKYLAYGVNDIKSGDIYRFNEKYNQLDFNQLYMAIPDINISVFTFNENEIQDILLKNIIIDSRNPLNRFVITNDNITNIASNYFFFIYNEIEFLVCKPKTNDYRWKITIFWDQLIIDAYNQLDTEFQNKYKTNFDNISNTNLKEDITKVEYMKLFDDIKDISVKEGIYDYDSFKDNVFIKQYNTILNIDIITKEYFDSVIYNSDKFVSQEILNDDILIELKTRLGVDSVSGKYYILDENESYSIRLLKVKYPDNDEFKWQILYLENVEFIEHE